MKTIIDKFLGWFKYPPITLTDPAKDKWLAKDKAWHFLGHFGIGFIYTKFLRDPKGGLVFSQAWGFQHELYDSARGQGFSWKDIAVNTLGWFIGTVCGWLI